MPKTILAVDDSATMRKVLEITFAGEDFRVVAVEGAPSAIARMSDGPLAAVIDSALDGDEGYALARDLRARDPRLAIVLLTSRYSPYDANRGREAGVDDYADKPFDTQALIDKVKKSIIARETTKPMGAPGPGATAIAPPAPAPPVVAPLAGAARANPSPVTGPAQRPGFPTQRGHTLSFEGGGPPGPAPAAAPTIARTAPSGTPIVQPPPARFAPAASQGLSTEQPVRAAAAARPGGDALAPAVGNGHLAGKLGELGLTAQQIDAVLALSREVVERVVWEVVPQLAEVLIKEEISRLTKDR